MVTDIKTRRLAGIRKETYEDLLKAAGIPAKYYCKRSFATWDILLPNEELATNLARGNITSKYFRLQPEYMGRKIKNHRVQYPYPIERGGVGRIPKRLWRHWRGGKDKVGKRDRARWLHFHQVPGQWRVFMAIPHTLDYESQVMTVVGEGRKPQCWNCKQLGHFSKSCRQKTTKTTTTTTTTIAAAAVTPKTQQKGEKALKLGNTQTMAKRAGPGCKGRKKEEKSHKNYHQQPYQQKSK